MRGKQLDMLKDRYVNQEPRFANYTTSHINRRFQPLC
jgi:hypothetical protein